MIVKEMFQAEDVYEYAAYCGFRDAAFGKVFQPKFWVKFQTGQDLQLIYELAFALESESRILFLTSEHSCIGSIVEWNDLTGYGKVRVEDEHNFTTHFSYTEMSEDKPVAEGQSVRVRFTYGNNGIEIKYITI